MSQLNTAKFGTFLAAIGGLLAISALGNGLVVRQIGPASTWAFWRRLRSGSETESTPAPA